MSEQGFGASSNRDLFPLSPSSAGELDSGRRPEVIVLTRRQRIRGLGLRPSQMSSQRRSWQFLAARMCERTSGAFVEGRVCWTSQDSSCLVRRNCFVARERTCKRGGAATTVGRYEFMRVSLEKGLEMCLWRQALTPTYWCRRHRSIGRATAAAWRLLAAL